MGWDRDRSKAGMELVGFAGISTKAWRAAGSVISCPLGFSCLIEVVKELEGMQNLSLEISEDLPCSCGWFLQW